MVACADIGTNGIFDFVLQRGKAVTRVPADSIPSAATPVATLCTGVKVVGPR